MDIVTIKKTPIIEYLASLGYYPTKNKGGGRLRYTAAWRGGENPNSISVDSEKNVWFDYARQHGGSIVDLCMQVNECNEAEALRILTEYNGQDTPKVAPIIPEVSKTSKASVTGVTDINNWRLIDYFKFQRCIDAQWLHAYCKQIYYKIDGKDTLFYAIGMENQSGGWIYRTAAPNGKGCIGVQDITVIPFTNAHKYMVFEGFTNFLSYLTLYGKPSVNVIVLNSVSNTNKAITYLSHKRPSALYLLLDNDNAGDTATQTLTGAFGNVAQDKRSHYAQFNDLNDYLVAQNGKR